MEQQVKKCFIKDGIRYDGCMGSAARGPDYCTCKESEIKEQQMEPQILGFFAYKHLPSGKLQETSRLFHDLAHKLQDELPDSAEKSVALRKLLEGKDAAVRSCLIPPVVK